MTLFSMPEAAVLHHGAPPSSCQPGLQAGGADLESSPKVKGPGQTVPFKIGLEDLGMQEKCSTSRSGWKFQRTARAYFLTFFHGQAGEVKLQFRSSSASPTVNGNFDTLSEAGVGDPERPIVVNGKVFSDPGAYKTLVEVTGIDNDKTDLPEPNTYEFNILVFVDQSFELS